MNLFSFLVRRCVLKFLVIYLVLIREITRVSSGSDNFPVPVGVNKSMEELFKSKILNEFDWRAYYELYPDLATHFSTRDDAIRHFLTNGYNEKRKFPKLFPTRKSIRTATRKLKSFVKQLDYQSIPQQERTLVFYYVNNFIYEDYSLEVAVNNIRIFNHSISYIRPSPVSSDSNQNASSYINRSTFYWFHVINGIDNVLQAYLPSHLKNVAEAHWELSPSDIFTHLRSLSFLRHLVEHFGTIVFLNQDMRGPLLFHEHGEWIQQYRSLLYSNNNGIVSTTFRCDTSPPTVDTSFFMIRQEVAPIILSNFMAGSVAAFPFYPKDAQKRSLRKLYDIKLIEVIQQHHYNISSYLYNKVLAKPSFDGYCLVRRSEIFPHDTNYWCDLVAEDVIFMKWGSQMTNQKELLCVTLLEYMTNQLINLQSQYGEELRLFIPESLKGGLLLHLFKEYDVEMWYNMQIPQRILNETTMALTNTKLTDKVCFLVRTSAMHDTSAMVETQRSIVDTIVEEGIEGIIRSLLRQTDPNWEAFFFITDDRPFEQRLQSILRNYSDIRLTYFDVPLSHRPKYSTLDAGYTPTDYVLQHLLQREDCRWLSATNADNIYGSGIVESVRGVLVDYYKNLQTIQELKVSSSRNDHLLLPGLRLFQQIPAPPDMIFTPLDTRNFPNSDYLERNTKHLWNQHCVGITATFKLHELGYTIQPRPALGKVDLAAVFFSRPKLLSERIFFGNFTDVERFPCHGCQDGYFTEYLVRKKLWKYERLPINGMKSVVFHGPSLTWCLAGGNTWFDHPEVNKVRCYSPQTIQKIRRLDTSQAKTLFDWSYYDTNHQLCLRFSEYGFAKQQETVAKEAAAKKLKLPTS